MKRILLLAISLLAVISCSTTKLIPEGSYRLVSNKVAFEGEKLPTNEVSQYIRQQAKKGVIFGWSPGLSIYNWSDGSGKGINKFWETLDSKYLEDLGWKARFVPYYGFGVKFGFDL